MHRTTTTVGSNQPHLSRARPSCYPRLAPAEKTGRGVLPRCSTSTAPRVAAAAAQAGRPARGVARIGEEGALAPCLLIAVTENSYSNLPRSKTPFIG